MNLPCVLPKSGFQTFDLPLGHAIAFLRKEDIEVQGVPEGWVLVTYQNIHWAGSKIWEIGSTITIQKSGG